jgi:hypothetical protein
VLASTVAWIAASVVWWFFTYRVTLGPLIAGSQIEIDGKRLISFSQPTGEYSTPVVSRGRHVLVVKAPGHMTSQFDFRIGWTGLRRRWTLAQVPEIVCVEVSGPPDATVTAGARWPNTPNRSEFCAPAGTHAVAERRADARQPPIRQAFEYADDGQVVALAAAQPEPTPPDPSASTSPVAQAPSSAPNEPVPSNTGGRERARQLIQSAQTLFSQRDYKAALAACNQALSLDPSNQEARRLQAQIRQTMQILGIQP